MEAIFIQMRCSTLLQLKALAQCVNSIAVAVRHCISTDALLQRGAATSRTAAVQTLSDSLSGAPQASVCRAFQTLLHVVVFVFVCCCC
jgi:hypothetical protein